MARRISPISPLLAFGVFALLANAAIAIVIRHNHSPSVTAASCADLLITLPAVYYLLVVRAGVQPLITIVPVLLSGLLRASFVASSSGVSRIIIAAGCELGIAWFLIRRGRKSLFARVLISELSIFYNALACWGMKPDVLPGGRGFSMHKESGTGLLFGLLAGLSLIEAACVHLVVRRWSTSIAWCISGLSVYGALLLIALSRSFTLRPIVVMRHSVLIRAGMLWSIEVARENIARIEAISPPFPDRGEPGYLRITGIADPNLILELRESSTAEGLFGRRKNVSRVGISADQPHELAQAVKAMIAGAF